MATLELVAELTGHTDRAWSVSWSPDGQQLASCSGDRTVRIWSRDPCSSADGWCCTSILEDGQTRTIRACAWSPNGRFLATASFDATTAIWERDGASWEQVATLEGHENEVKSVAWSPNGSLIATCGRDKSVWIWESIPGNEYECVDVKQGHSQDVKCVAWHPSGEILASASYDDSIRLWTSDGDEWTCGQTLGGPGGVGHTSTVWSVAFQPSGDHMVSCSDDCTLRVWACRRPSEGEAGSGAAGEASPSTRYAPPWRLLCTLSGYHSRTVYCCDWGPAGLIAAGDGDNAIRVYAQASPDGDLLDLSLPPAPAIFGTDPTPSTSTHPQGSDDRSHAHAGGADDRSYAHAGGADDRSYAHWQPLGAVSEAHGQDVNCVRWHPHDATLLASAGDDGKVKLWRLRLPGAAQAS